MFRRAAIASALFLAGCGGTIGVASGDAAPDAAAHGEAGVGQDATAAPDVGGPCVVTHQAMGLHTERPEGMVSDATRLYWFDNANGFAAIHFTTKCTPSGVTDLAMLPLPANAIAEDAQSLYLAAFSSDRVPLGAVFAVDKGSGAAQPLVMANGGAAGVAAGGGWIYWGDGSSASSVGRVRPDGSAAQQLPLAQNGVGSVAVLADGTVCALGSVLMCLLSSQMTVQLVTPFLGKLASDATHVYALVSNPAPPQVERFAPASDTATVLSVPPGDAGGGPVNSSEASFAVVSRGVYILYGTGTLAWIPNDGSPPTQTVIGSWLPPIPFYADEDGIYWDGGNGLEMAPPPAH